MKNNIGLLPKYRVSKTSGKPLSETFDAFILRLDEEQSDKINLEACRKAGLFYANEIKDHLPQLAIDLVDRYSQVAKHPDRLYTEGEVVQIIYDLLQCPGIIIDAVQNEDTNWDADAIFDHFKNKL
jgi:hypothetical protein